MSGFFDYVLSSPVARILSERPESKEFFAGLNLPPLDESRTLADALSAVDDYWLDEFGLDRERVPRELAEFLESVASGKSPLRVSSLTILGGIDKSGNAEDAELTLALGDVVSIVGPTGSGKSRLLADIECVAQRDTPTRRQILIDGKPQSEDFRFSLEGKLVAQLSQNMNFVMDLSVAEFLEMHARSRGVAPEASVLAACFSCATDLAGESFTENTKVTQLSGGQSRALMIADCAYISQSPIVLIDEIENAGVDRVKALEILAENEKIVLISTHDPLLALGADKRIVIKNGGIYRILETSEEEKRSVLPLVELDRRLSEVRARLRAGERIEDN
ncbi:MAG: ATP-binding cassette domain-containing protein [Oscillospiraceae bacterium]|jgi:ABC-type lipoprotein export system ATPase subunit|nr:ATP-binding cassette domain-containing protein [Oscillospiraceae bacterium]